jgi:hypothetical protein
MRNKIPVFAGTLRRGRLTTRAPLTDSTDVVSANVENSTHSVHDFIKP